jgi:hypothetical protein
MTNKLECLGQVIEQLSIKHASGAVSLVCTIYGLNSVKSTRFALFYERSSIS